MCERNELNIVCRLPPLVTFSGYIRRKWCRKYNFHSSVLSPIHIALYPLYQLYPEGSKSGSTLYRPHSQLRYSLRHINNIFCDVWLATNCIYSDLEFSNVQRQRKMRLKPGFHSNTIACVACVAFEWKPDFRTAHRRTARCTATCCYMT